MSEAAHRRLAIVLAAAAVLLAAGLAVRWKGLLDDRYAGADVRLDQRVLTGDAALATVSVDGRLGASGEAPTAVRLLAVRDGVIVRSAAATGDALARDPAAVHDRGEAVAAEVEVAVAVDDVGGAVAWPSNPGGGGVRAALLAAAGGEAAAPRADGEPGPLLLLLDLYEQAADAGGLAGLAEQRALEAVFDEVYSQRRVAPDQVTVTKLLGVLDADDAGRVRAAVDRAYAIGGAAGAEIEAAKRDALAAPEQAAAFAARVRAVQEAYAEDPAGTRRRLWEAARAEALGGDARVVLGSTPR